MKTLPFLTNAPQFTHHIECKYPTTAQRGNFFQKLKFQTQFALQALRKHSVSINIGVGII